MNNNNLRVCHSHEHLLQATCECGFASMEESQLKVVEELQHQHQQEVERLLVERDRLLEEESAATAIGEELSKMHFKSIVMPHFYHRLFRSYSFFTLYFPKGFYS